jgi:hypothetical protein
LIPSNKELSQDSALRLKYRACVFSFFSKLRQPSSPGVDGVLLRVALIGSESIIFRRKIAPFGGVAVSQCKSDVFGDVIAYSDKFGDGRVHWLPFGRFHAMEEIVEYREQWLRSPKCPMRRIIGNFPYRRLRTFVRIADDPLGLQRVGAIHLRLLRVHRRN